MLKKAALILLGLFLGWKLLGWVFNNPNDAAQKLNEAGETANKGGDSAITFVTALSGGALLLLVGVIIAIIIARRSG